MAVQACLPVEEGGLGGCVVYIDTEAAFSPKRYVSPIC
jgi:RecA/RadA recombinase